MGVDIPSSYYDPDLDEVAKAEMWLEKLLRDYGQCRDGKVSVRNPQNLFGSLDRIYRLLSKYRIR